MTGSHSAAIEVSDLQVSYGSQRVLHGVNLSVAPGEFIAILGSSGCGKTTLLRTIAGFQKASGGAIRLFGRDVVNTPPEKRGIAMMFQSYALWPHMTVLGNVGYGLRLRGVPRDEIRSRVASVLKMLNLSGLEERKVTNLSGGQRQRVALGRALAIEPEILLLDEPLSNLDAKVRIQVRSEIKALQKQLGFTAIQVTHDREEAMTMADRIVVMEAGRIAQVGSPEEVFDHPNSPFVASFMGAENTIALDVRPSGAGVEVRAAGGSATTWTGTAPVGGVTAYFRDDVASLDDPNARIEGSIVLPGTITQRTYPGGHYRYVVAIDDRHFTVTDSAYHELDRPVRLRLPLASLHLFPTEMIKGGNHA
ncbi:ABC transporter ATP-binding protein [Microvirga subterranea]|uniref:Carbohydrate ABC transporter ATP-binding protein (CUT1 family) n=1 Tax=Microvirga subterranea TaxID=186651 RepID=A0A370HR97_9HYPH|nr:ABC transporter ATP-binding protein [Microvirga subterranea]RDI60820.1 carbohydrate ABC transporter ATP-binding protein (CUT1 family) [Microvirga subterranea]